MYKVWTHKMALDTVQNRLFLTYYSQSLGIWVNIEDYNAYINIWRDREKAMLETWSEPPGNGYYWVKPSEMCTLISENGGDTWRLAVTDDF